MRLASCPHCDYSNFTHEPIPGANGNRLVECDPDSAFFEAEVYFARPGDKYATRRLLACPSCLKTFMD